MTFISNLIIPVLVLIVLLYGMYKKVDIYDEFLNGASESFKMIFENYATGLILEEDYIEKIESLKNETNQINKKIQKYEDEIKDSKAQVDKLIKFIEELPNLDDSNQLDMIRALVSKVIVKNDEVLKFHIIYKFEI